MRSRYRVLIQSPGEIGTVLIRVGSIEVMLKIYELVNTVELQCRW
jgi:hypothetical protein